MKKIIIVSFMKQAFALVNEVEATFQCTLSAIGDVNHIYIAGITLSFNVSHVRATTSATMYICEPVSDAVSTVITILD
jgi:hypothetical protein